MTYEEFAEQMGITMTCKQIPSRQSSETWPPGSTHWRCHLKRGRNKMQVTYSMGSAHRGTPVLADVLQSVALDASIWEANDTYEEFLDEFGYDDDRRHRQTWLAIQKEGQSLYKLLDEDDGYYETLLYHTTEE